ncbi:MAG: TlpA disulfide reductase family protein [Pseudomonadota bacterium]
MGWVCLGFLLALLLTGCAEDRPPAPVNGQAAPGFTLERLDGARVTLPVDLAGRVVAVRFWADWCPYCRKEMAALQPVHARLHAQGLEILAVNVAQDRDTARRFAESIGIAYPVLLDPEGATARAYGVQALPVTWLVDRQGILRGKILGEATAELFETRVKALLDER